MAAGRSFQYGITLASQDFDHHLAQGVFIFCDEDGFGAATENVINRQFRFLSHLLARRKVNPKCRALVRFTVHIQPALVLLDNTKNRGKAQAGALSSRLCCEERLEDSTDDLRVHPDSVVAESKTNIFTVATFRIHWRGRAVNGLQ